MKKFTVSLIQMTSQNDWEKNLEKIQNWIHQELKPYPRRDPLRPSLICLPENFAFFGSELEKRVNLQAIVKATRSFLSRISKEEGIYILGGGYPYPARNGKYYNQASLYSPQGEEIFRYRKIHLFDTTPGDGIHYKESATTQRGRKLPEVMDLGFCKFTSFICYDIRFPEVFRAVGKKGVEVIALPAAFTIPTGKAHWEILLRARAIENFCYVVAPAQVGVNIPGSNSQGQRATYGHSMVVDPWGNILACMDGRTEGILSATLDPSPLEMSRKKIPALTHRVFFSC